MQYTAVDVQGSGVIQADPATLSTSAGWTQNSYQPYGAARPRGPNTWTGDQKWLNLDHDPGLDLVQTGARLYDQALQQFITPDPLLNTSNPNPYIYAANNPISFSDPSGLYPEWVPPITLLLLPPPPPTPDSNFSNSPPSGPIQQPSQGTSSGSISVGNIFPPPSQWPIIRHLVETGPPLAAEFSGGQDVVNCYSDGGWACLWAALILTPVGKIRTIGGPIVKGLTKAGDDLVDAGQKTTGKNGGVGPVRKGQAGENAVRSQYDIGPKAHRKVNGNNRIFDGLNKRAVTEVKNVKYQAYTQQIKDSLQFAKDNGRQFHLFVRSGPEGVGTDLSGPLKDAIASNKEIFKLRFIP